MAGPAFDSRTFLSQLTTQSGVYRMYDASEGLLYVGKARNLKKRVGSYFLRASGDPRIESMVEQIRRIEVTVTHTEDEALLLEATLIKEWHPRYNILYRDDKSYPYLRFTAHPYPRIGSYRGARNGKDRYFGPYVSSVAVRESALILQKLFRLRPCNDHFFSHRQRPCLQYQIKRCSAPCVRLISEESYALDVRNAERLLTGKGQELGKELQTQMEEASQHLDYERAAQLRDQIAALSQVQQSRTLPGTDADSDVIAVTLHAAHSCIVVMSLRGGLNLGHRSYFPSHPHNVDEAELLSGFLAQFYLDRSIPSRDSGLAPAGGRRLDRERAFSTRRQARTHYGALAWGAFPIDGDGRRDGRASAVGTAGRQCQHAGAPQRIARCTGAGRSAGAVGVF